MTLTKTQGKPKRLQTHSQQASVHAKICSSIRRIAVLAISITSLAIVITSCREDDEIFIPETVTVSSPVYSSITGFYLLNEGNMGSNECTLDYYDYSTGVYTRNIYGDANPTVVKELGDVGNDIAIYGSRLWAVINCSNKVEVMNADDCVRIGQVEIPNCRYIKFHEGYAYVTSYAGPVELNPDYEQLGYVAKVDTASLEVVDTCLVGYQPDGIEIVDGKIYVANSGGYMAPNYARTVSVIDIESFTVTDEIDVDINLQYLCCDTHGGLWISSRGDYAEEIPQLYCYDVRKERIVATLDVAAGDMWLDGDSLYCIGTSWSNITMSYDQVTYSIVDVNLMEVVCDNFISDGTDQSIKIPYGVAVNPLSKEIFVTDARNYVNPGYLYCFSSDGTLQWSVRTGDIPAHFAFTGSASQQ